MSQANFSGERSYEAAASLIASQYCAVKLDSNGKVVLATASTDKILGILQNAPIAGDTARVQLLNAGGTTKMRAGEALATLMTRLTIDSTGRAIASTQVAGTAQPSVEIVGQNMEVAAAANNLIEVTLDHDLI